MITIGIDPHKSSLTAVVVDPAGQQLASRRLPMTVDAAERLLEWATPWPKRRFAVEGAAGLGRGIAQLLAAAGEDVVDVPATLSVRARLLDSGGGRKTDVSDAASVAAVASGRAGRLRQVVAEDHTVVLRLLCERREDLAATRVQIANRLHSVLRDLVAGGAPRNISAPRAAALLASARPITVADQCRRDIASDLLTDLRRVDELLKVNQRQARAAIRGVGSSLTSIHGVGVVIAVKILGHVADIRRFPTADHFASYTGAAPLEASSGDRRRHRLNTGGNRQLNSALHTIAVCQARDPGPGRAYYQRKLDEGKTPAEARRALKRRLATVIFRTLARDRKLSAA